MKRLLITCTEEEEQEFLELARQYKTSASLLGQYAIRQFLATAKTGARPMLKPSTNKHVRLHEATGSIHLPD